LGKRKERVKIEEEKVKDEGIDDENIVVKVSEEFVPIP
jgi:hypothetical protein